jgi:uncharacterized Ntn-hydrolase superfamily protein
MTFSVVATDGSCWGVAVASKFLAVGALVPAAEAGVGAIATQAMANLRYRPDGLHLLRSGATAEQTVRTLTGGDDDAAHRQLGVVDRDGGSATFTGEQCLTWAGGARGPGYAMQGNILTGAQVIADMEQTFLHNDAPFPARLLAALRAGDAAGGDRRGRQSAALLVLSPGAGYLGGDDVVVDLRVDDHPDPVRELGRLLDVHELYFGKPQTLLPMTGELGAEVQSLLARVGFATLAEWAGVENLENRLVDKDLIDAVVLDALRAAAGR